jgi:hypothetical protein
LITPISFTIRHSQLSLITDTIEGFHEFTPAAIAGLPFHIFIITLMPEFSLPAIIDLDISSRPDFISAIDCRLFHALMFSPCAAPPPAPPAELLPAAAFFERYAIARCAAAACWRHDADCFSLTTDCHFQPRFD